MAPIEIVRSILSSALAPLLIFTVVAGFIGVFGLTRARMPWLVLSVTVTGIVTAVGIAYLMLPILFEDAETDIACVSALAMRGLPIYPAIDAAPRYILLYGPLTYLAHIPLYWIFGQNLVAFKLLGAGALLVSLFGIYEISRAYAGPRASMIGLGCASLVFFRYLGVEFWGRIDPLIVALIVLSIWATIKWPLWVVILVDGIAVGVIPNLKVSGFAYLLPVVALLVIRKGWGIAGACAVLGLVLLPVPFLLPAVSLTNYLVVLQTAARHGLVLNFLVRNLQYSILLLLPVLVTLRVNGPSTAQLLYLSSIVTGLAITSVFGSKSGAGSYHLIPYVVPILYLYFWQRSERARSQPDSSFSRVGIAWAVTTLFLASTHVQNVIHAYRGAFLGQSIVREIRNDEDLYRGRTIEVGVGKDFEDPRIFYGFLTTFQGQPYTLAGAAVRDLQVGGIPTPVATMRYMEACGTQVWLIPKNEAPFSAQNTYYETPHPAFEAAFQQAFVSQYHRVTSGKLFDAWVCGREMD